MKSRSLIRLGISVAVFALFMLHVSGLARLRLLETVENFSYDARMLLTLPKTTDPRVVIVDLDEKTLAAEGWPWSRDKWAALITQLFERYGVRTLGFDVGFLEPDDRVMRMFDDLSARQLADLPGLAARAPQIRESFDYDRQFADALHGKPIVMGYFFRPYVPQGEAPTKGALCAPLLDKNSASLYTVNFPKAAGYVGNVERLQQAAVHCGFFENPLVDGDGVFRRVPLMQSYEGQVYPSLALSVVRLALGNAPVEMEFEPPELRTSLNLENVHIGPLVAPVDGEVAVYVPFRGPAYTFQYISATDVLHGAVAEPQKLRNVIVLVGTTAAGLLDLRNTPVGPVYPGVEVHANIVSGLLDGRIRQKAPYYTGIETVLLLLIGGLVAWGFVRLSPLGSTGVALALVAGVLALGFGLWSGAHFIMPVGMPITYTLTLLMVQLFYGFFIESRGKRQMSRQFGQYVPPEVVAEMTERGGEISLEGESRDMTVLFSDVRGFTSISEKLDAKELAQLMNLFLTKQTAIIHKHRGTIDKYMGDAVMAFWGAPLHDEAHALHGVQAGMEMLTAVRELDDEFARRGWPKLNIGVGLNSGKMNVGNMGSEFRMAYTVMGDAVNLGSRVEGLTKKYGVGIIVTEFTRNQLPSDWAYRELDLVRVKGKNEPVAIYEPMGPKDQLDPELRTDLARHRGAMKLYREQNWDAAEAEFFSLSQSPRAHRIYELFIERIMTLRENPPGKGWDGAYTHDEK